MEDLKHSSYQIKKTDDPDMVIISWIITHACQERCDYCISLNVTRELTTREDHFAIQNKLIADGLTKNRYIGGEPLIVPHSPDLIADAHNKGVNTRPSTNGVLLTEHLDGLSAYKNNQLLYWLFLYPSVDLGLF